MIDISREIDKLGLGVLTVISAAVKIHLGMVCHIFRNIDLVFIAATRA
jgi:hypothetical protein